jgi:hypothetical protein
MADSRIDRLVPGRRLRRVGAAFGGLLLAAGVLAGCDPSAASPGAGPVSSSTLPIATSSSELPSSGTDLPATADSTTAESAVAAAPAQSVAPAQPAAPAPVAAKKTTKAAAPPKSSASCTGNYYVNSSGNCVERPTAGDSGGATAKCKDGKYSYSQHRSGTCSGHGGVAEWL